MPKWGAASRIGKGQLNKKWEDEKNAKNKQEESTKFCSNSNSSSSSDINEGKKTNSR